MATYLKFHQLKRSPFEGRESNQLVLATASLRSAYADIRSSLQENSPRICLSGGSGIGKSSFARALPKLLESEAQCILARDPGGHWSRLEASIARQLALPSGRLSRNSLMAVRQQGRRIVIVIDQAEELPSESLEQLDVVLGYLDDESNQLVHCVLLANLDAAPRGREIPLLWWLDQLATRQLRFSPIPQEGIRSYIDNHLNKAGCRRASIFDEPSVKAIHRYTGGVPGAVGALCEELLSRAAELQQHEIDAELVASVCGDEPPAKPEAQRAPAERPLQPVASDARPETVSNTPAPSPPRQPALRAPEPVAAPEPELEIQQGLVHMEQPDRTPGFGSLSDGDPFTAFRPPRVAPWPRKKPIPAAPQASPGSGRGARMVRNLIGLALLVCLAMMIHLTFFAGEPGVPPLATPPAKRLDEAPPTPSVEAATAVANSQPAWRNHSFAAAAPGTTREAILAGESRSGLTSDLRLDPSTSHAQVLAEPGGEVGNQLEATALPAIHEGTAATREEPSAFEPWAEQAPEPATPPYPAAPAAQP